MNLKKICYLTTIGLTIRAFFIPQLKALAENGYDVSVICSFEEGLKEKLGCKIHYYPVDIPRGISCVSMVKAVCKINAIVRDKQFDIIQYSTPNAGLCGAVVGKIQKVPIRNYHLMGLRYLGEKGLKRFILKLLEKITCMFSTDIECVSKSNYKMSINEGLFRQEKGTVVFHGSTGGVELKKFNYNLRKKYREEIRAKYNIADSVYVYGFVGRITRDKGINELLKAFKQMPGCILLMVGFTDETDTIDRELYVWSKNCNSIIYTGAVDDVERYYAAMDCLVLPSYREGFGNVVIEAAAMGTPAIVTRIPGPIDTSIENRTALWINPYSVGELKQAMIKMQYISKNMEISCVSYVLKCFDNQKLISEILKRKNHLYEKTINK